MKKAIMIAAIGLASTFALYASLNAHKQTEETKPESCDKTTCCPDRAQTKGCCGKLCG